MDESSEFIGSMPSTPQPKPQPPAPAPVARTGNAWNLVTYSLWGICFLLFPLYTGLNDLGRGVFDGAGILILFMVFVVLCGLLSRLATRNRPPKTTQARQTPGSPRRLGWLNGVLAGVVIFLLGVYLMIAPGILDESGLLGIFICIMGLAVIFLSLIRLISALLFPTRNEARPGGSAQAKKPAQGPANTIRGSIYLLFTIGILLAFAHGADLNDFTRGICYGISLVLLLMTITALGNVMVRISTKKMAQPS